MVTLVKKRFHVGRNLIRGEFVLSDGSRTQFRIHRDLGYSQWGNDMRKLKITEPLLEQMENELL